MPVLPIHSPIEEIYHPLLSEKGIRLLLKRDDLIDPLISGNKWRKLKYPLQKAEKDNKKHAVTFGGVWSNHLLATSCAAAKFGFKSTGIVRGEDVDSDILFFCRLFGMNVHFVSRDEYKDKQNIYFSMFGDDREAFFIDEGGSSSEGALGCSEIIDELDLEYTHLFCACGTGTTAAGLMNGISRHRLPTTFHGVPVLKGGEFLKQEINKFLTEPINYNLHTEYHFGGYAKSTPELLNFIKTFSSSTGIIIDPVYTGKMLYAVFDLASKDYFRRGDTILAIHTGGLFGLLGMKERFKTIV